MDSGSPNLFVRDGISKANGIDSLRSGHRCRVAIFHPFIMLTVPVHGGDASEKSISMWLHDLKMELLYISMSSKSPRLIKVRHRSWCLGCVE